MADRVKFGPTFHDELVAAGIGDLLVAWGSDGDYRFRDDKISNADKKKLDAVIAAHNPEKQKARVAKKISLDADKDVQDFMQLANMTSEQLDQWFDDNLTTSKESIAVLKKVVKFLAMKY